MRLTASQSCGADTPSYSCTGGNRDGISLKHADQSIFLFRTRLKFNPRAERPDTIGP